MECSQGVTLNFEFLNEYQTFVVYDVEFIWFYFLRNVSQGVTLSSFVGIKLMLYVEKFIWSHILRNVHKVLF